MRTSVNALNSGVSGRALRSAASTTAAHRRGPSRSVPWRSRWSGRGGPLRRRAPRRDGGGDVQRPVRCANDDDQRRGVPGQIGGQLVTLPGKHGPRPRTAIPSPSAPNSGRRRACASGRTRRASPDPRRGVSLGPAAYGPYLLQAHDIGIEPLQGFGDSRCPLEPWAVPPPDVPRHDAQGVLHITQTAATAAAVTVCSRPGPA
jgi:hypothetical protein